MGRSAETPPSEKLNIAGIGVGGMGAGDVNAVSGGNNIVALCDVDLNRSGGTFQKFPAAKAYRDFRKMFDEMEKDIDAVVVATPDHTHAVAAMAAIKRGKHVYCEKPLAHSVYEVRQLMKAAAEHNVVTQLGNQGHSSDSIRVFCEWIWDGAIGKVHTIHAGCRAVNSGLGALSRLQEQHAVPGQRVINVQGKISIHGDGIGNALQRVLLEEEGVVFDSEGRVDFIRFGWRMGD